MKKEQEEEEESEWEEYDEEEEGEEEMEEMDSLQTTLLSELKTGKEAMWDWMYAIKAPKKLRDSLSHEKSVSYLVNEQASIDEVKRLMIEAKNNSEVLYEE